MTEHTLKPSTKSLIKFILLLALLAGYFAYLSYTYDLLTGGIAAMLTWSFFVLCTPIADAGFLLDFPLRLLFGIRMFISELIVWAIAISLNAFALLEAPTYYQTTTLTRLLHHIIITPIPYWSIILLSAAGTFLSVRFGDEIMDTIHNREQGFFHSPHFRHMLRMGFVFIVIIVIYYELMASLGISETL